MTRRHTIAVLPVAILGTALLLGASACDGGGSSPTAPESSRLSMARAAVSVDGTVYNGGTFHHGQGHGSSTLFEARLTLDGSPAPGREVWVRYGHGMMTGRFRLHDDGTHGDPVPGDGIYCLEDAGGAYGFHHAGAPHGRYHYEFWGENPDGRHSDHLEVSVQVTD